MHPSLSQPFRLPAPLIPTEKMGRNEKCWCGSGRKWKKCHYNREREKELPVGAILAQLNQELTTGYCLHPEASPSTCSKKIIRAHTVQRKGGLAAITEHGHVMSVKKGFEKIAKNKGAIVPERVGVRSASTFNGFCGEHDNRMFEPIENGSISLNPETAFLLSFRAVCYEYFQKEASIRGIVKQRQFLDRGKKFVEQVKTQQHFHLFVEGMRRGMNDLKSWKNEYDRAFLKSSYKEFSFYAVRFSGILPIVASGAFYPEYDLSGNPLQSLNGSSASYEHICFNLTSIQDKSVLVVGWVGQKGGPAESFFESYYNLPNAEKSNSAFYIAIEQLENIYFQPSWWTRQPVHIKGEMNKRFNSGMSTVGSERTSDSLINFPYQLSSLTVEDELINPKRL